MVDLSISRDCANTSLAESLASLHVKQRRQILSRLSGRQIQATLHDWRFWARPNQLAPDGAWRIWLMLAGRGFGKTRCGAEWIRERVTEGKAGRIALVGPTAADVRDVMVEGESGLLSIYPHEERPDYQPSIRRLTWPNGAIATAFSADEPDRLRGYQSDSFWADELAAWRYAQESWDQLQFGHRLGTDPRGVVTTTPKPLELVRRLIARHGQDVHVTRGSSYDNAANLPPQFLDTLRRRYEGTQLGRQEIYADVLEQAEGALWQREWFERGRLTAAPELRRITVNVDPAATDTASSDETGIVVTGADERGYVLEDLSGRYSPDGWARAAILAYVRHRANYIVAERNNGGDMVRFTIEATAREMHRSGQLPSPFVPVTVVWASRGKAARAEPVAALYEQGRVSHVGTFPALEDQLVTWEPAGGERSPDRLDALVWGFTQLMIEGQEIGTIKVVGY
jgi:phage terminase large subunit-like protein